MGFASKELLLGHLECHKSDNKSKGPSGSKSPRFDIESLTLSPKQLKHNTTKNRGGAQSEVMNDDDVVGSPSTPSFATLRIGSKKKGAAASPKFSSRTDSDDSANNSDHSSPKAGFHFQKWKVDPSRPPTVAELERDIDYSALEELPPLPDQVGLLLSFWLVYFCFQRLR